MRLPTLLLLALPPPTAPTDGGELEALLDRARQGDLPGVEELAGALVAVGPNGAEHWYDAMELRREDRELLFPEDAPPVLSADTLARLGRSTAAVPAELAGRLEELGPRAAAAAQVGLDVLARTGSTQDLDLALELARPREDMTYESHRPIGRRMASTVTTILRRDETGYARVQGAFAEGHEWLDLHLLRGLGGTRTARGLQVLPYLLGVVPRLDASVLLEIGNLARFVETPLEDAALHRVRRYLTSPDTEERRQAAVAVGRLDDYDSVDPLIDLLADEERGVRTNAYWALREVTAMTIDANPNRWRQWFDEETGWWAEESAELLSYLRHHDSAEVCRAINECARKRLYRRHLTPHLLPMLEHRNPTVVRAACSAFFALRATDAAPAMASALAHERADVRAHAHEMLQGLTGRQLPPDPREWREALREEHPEPR